MKKSLISFVVVAVTAIAANAQVTKFDVNSDTEVNSADVVAIYNYIITGDMLEMKKQVFVVNGIAFTMMPVEGGSFMMGATAEQEKPYDGEMPAHQVTLSSYHIGRTEVTQELWEAVMGSNPSYTKGDLLPVTDVSWNDCQTFISKLNTLLASQLDGRKFRLPTEAEWEFAARGGNKSMHYQYSGSNTINEVAWYVSNSDDKTHPVASKQPNELSIYDMSGNVCEWCQDWYGDYSSEAQTNPAGPESGSYRVSRGGSWMVFASICRLAYRITYTPTNTLGFLGLRLALSR